MGQSHLGCRSDRQKISTLGDDATQFVIDELGFHSSDKGREL